MAHKQLAARGFDRESSAIVLRRTGWPKNRDHFVTAITACNKKRLNQFE